MFIQPPASTARPSSTITDSRAPPLAPFFLLIIVRPPCSSFFFFKDPATPEIYPLSLHAALPICRRWPCWRWWPGRTWNPPKDPTAPTGGGASAQCRTGHLPDRQPRWTSPQTALPRRHQKQRLDRKSTRLNSSHT